MDDFNPQNPLSAQVQQAQQARQQLSQDQTGKSKSRKLIIIFIILVLLVIGVFLIIRGLSGDSGEVTQATPTPNNFIKTPSAEEKVEEEATPAPEENVDKSSITVEILNGTGISGEAGFLRGKLEALGFKNISAGNASSSDNETTVVTFSDDLASSIVDEITQLLKKTYNDLTTKTSSSGKDISIITGLRSGQTLKPTSSPSPTSAN